MSIIQIIVARNTTYSYLITDLTQNADSYKVDSCNRQILDPYTSNNSHILLASSYITPNPTCAHNLQGLHTDGQGSSTHRASRSPTQYPETQTENPHLASISCHPLPIDSKRLTIYTNLAQTYYGPQTVVCRLLVLPIYPLYNKLRL